MARKAWSWNYSRWDLSAPCQRPVHALPGHSALALRFSAPSPAPYPALSYAPPRFRTLSARRTTPRLKPRLHAPLCPATLPVRGTRSSRRDISGDIFGASTLPDGLHAFVHRRRPSGKRLGYLEIVVIYTSFDFWELYKRFAASCSSSPCFRRGLPGCFSIRAFSAILKIGCEACGNLELVRHICLPT